MAIGISEIGSYVPEKFLSNDDLSKMVDTNDEWIRTRTGIQKRHIADESETTADMGYKAALNLVEQHKESLEGVDLVICSTATAEYRFPSVAAFVAERLDLGEIPAFDIGPACSGFIYLLNVAQAYVKSGMAKKVLCLTAEKMSSIVDWTDRNTCVLFGDGCSAFLVQDSPSAHEIIKSNIGGTAKLALALYTEWDGKLNMDGSTIFKQGVRVMTRELQKICEATQTDVSDLNWIVPHQANRRIIQSIGERLTFPSENIYINIERYANTSSSTIPLALSDMKSENLLKKGDLLGLIALGGGLTWGSAIIRW